MQAIPVGTVVGIRVGNVHYGAGPSNPADVSGVVMDYHPDLGDYAYRVRWDNGHWNQYRRIDLKYWKGPRANKPAKKPAPKKAFATEEELERAVDRAKKEVFGKWYESGYTGCFAFVTKKAEIILTRMTACHNDVLWGPREGEYGEKNKASVHAVVTLIRRPNEKKEIVLPYFHWLFNDSPWASAFVEKDANAAYDSGCVVTTSKVPANLLQAALIATRNPKENMKRVVTFAKLVDMGVEGNLAYIACSCLMNSPSNPEQYELQMHGGNHYAIDPSCMSVEDAKRFIVNEPRKLTDMYDEEGNSMAVHDMFRGKERNRGLRTLFDKIVREAGATRKSVKNPFAVAKPRQDKIAAPLRKIADKLKEKFDA